MTKVQLVTTIIGGFFLAVILYLFQFGGWTQIKKCFMERPSIEVRSMDSFFSDQVISGQKLRFMLSNVKSTRVFWVFNESEVVPGHVELEYRFPYKPDIESDLPPFFVPPLKLEFRLIQTVVT